MLAFKSKTFCYKCRDSRNKVQMTLFRGFTMTKSHLKNVPLKLTKRLL